MDDKYHGYGYIKNEKGDKKYCRWRSGKKTREYNLLNDVEIIEENFKIKDF